MNKKHFYLDYPIGTVFKEIYGDEVNYYILGTYFVYCNYYNSPEIRPHKFNLDYCIIASEEEKKQFIEQLKENHLIWNEETGKVEREYKELTLTAKVKVHPDDNINDVVKKLNLELENPFYIYNIKFEKAAYER